MSSSIPGVTPAEARLRATMLSPGSVTDTVDVAEKIGVGGFSVVRAGVLRATGARVAIKVIIPTHYSTGPQRLAALHEVMVLRKLGALRCSSILRLHSAHEDRSPSTGQLRLSLCTELVEGGELFDEISKLEHFSEHSASRLIRRLAETLALVHAAGVLHRDLKPENVLLRSRSDAAEPVLADFGLALISGEVDAAGAARDLVGTHAYMAPEIVTSRLYSPASDVWVLGVLAYILVGGYHPFNDDPSNVPALLQAIASCRFEFHEDVWATTSPEVRDLIGRILVPDPKARLDIAGILAHPWITNHAAMPSSHLTVSMGRMRAFNARRKVRAAVQALIFGARHLKLTRAALGLRGNEFGAVELVRLRAAFNRVATAKAGVAAAAAAAATEGGLSPILAATRGTAAALESRSVSLVGFRAVCREVGMEDDVVADRLFHAFDLDNSGDVDWRELLAGALSLRDEGSESSIELAFSVFDENGDGTVSREELVQLLVATGYCPPQVDEGVGAAGSARAGADYGAEEHNRVLVRLNALFERIDLNGDGRITLDEFRAAFKSDAGAKEAMMHPLRRFNSRASGVNSTGGGGGGGGSSSSSSSSSNGGGGGISGVSGGSSSSSHSSGGGGGGGGGKDEDDSGGGKTTS